MSVRNKIEAVSRSLKPATNEDAMGCLPQPSISRPLAWLSPPLDLLERVPLPPSPCYPLSSLLCSQCSSVALGGRVESWPPWFFLPPSAARLCLSTSGLGTRKQWSCIISKLCMLCGLWPETPIMPSVVHVLKTVAEWDSCALFTLCELFLSQSLLAFFHFSSSLFLVRRGLLQVMPLSAAPLVPVILFINKATFLPLVKLKLSHYPMQYLFLISY